MKFKLVSDFKQTDVNQVIRALSKGFLSGNQCQTLLGVTGLIRHLLWQILYRIFRSRH